MKLSWDSVDIKNCVKMQNIIMYPAEVTDVYSEAIRPLVEKAINVSMELDESVPGKPIKGYLTMMFYNFCYRHASFWPQPFGMLGSKLWSSFISLSFESCIVVYCLEVLSCDEDIEAFRIANGN